MTNLENNSNVLIKNSDIITELTIALESADTFLEGANTDIRNYTKEYKKVFSENIKVAKKAIKNNELDTARKAVKKATDVTEKYEKELDKIDSTVGEAIIGFIIGDLISSGRQLILLPASVLTGGIVGTVKALADLIEEVVVMVNEFKKNDEITPDIFNNYKTKCKVLINHKLKILKKLEVKIMEMEEAEKEIKESVSILENVCGICGTEDVTDEENSIETKVHNKSSMIEYKLSVHERCDRGEISEEERDVLLEAVKDIEDEETDIVEESVDDYIDSIFERFENDLISEEERDVLLEGANVDIMKVMSAHMIDYKKYVSEAKKLIRKKEFDKAEIKIDDCTESINKIIDEVNSIPDSAMSSIISRLPGFLTKVVVASVALGTFVTKAIRTGEELDKERATQLPDKKNNIYDDYKYTYSDLGKLLAGGGGLTVATIIGSQAASNLVNDKIDHGTINKVRKKTVAILQDEIRVLNKLKLELTNAKKKNKK